MHLGDRGIFADRAAKDDVTVASEGIHAGTADSVLRGFGFAGTSASHTYVLRSKEEAAQMRDRRDDVTVACKVRAELSQATDLCDIRREEKKDAQPSKWAAACDCGSDARDAMTRGDDENEVSTAM